jgi:hypothetical protein
MAIWGSRQRKKACFLFFFFVVFAAFAADIVDLREDIHILSCPHGSVDSNITTCIQSLFSFVPDMVRKFCSLSQKSSVVISLFHLFPFGYRAPPILS